jgi:serine/threonine protein kinase
MDGSKISHYRILEKLGAGGMGEVYLAEDMKLGRKVAIKILSEEYTTNRDRLNRFEQEASAASALNHPIRISSRFGKMLMRIFPCLFRQEKNTNS